MAAKNKSAKESEATVVRVKAQDTPGTEKKSKKTPKQEVASSAASLQPPKAEKQRKNPIKASGGYFKGAWQELRQVRWPNRRATWSMTAALLVFTAFFVALILLLDALFKYIFQLMLGS
ncbi:MAG TPA: preprotein translocase subunit SecE [Candidatus Saccharimonadales bacterium]|nr:preprotein translocase subunit SecE [Candidatus Saccharimonadales bacterium]